MKERNWAERNPTLFRMLVIAGISLVIFVYLFWAGFITTEQDWTTVMEGTIKCSGGSYSWDCEGPLIEGLDCYSSGIVVGCQEFRYAQTKEPCGIIEVVVCIEELNITNTEYGSHIRFFIVEDYYENTIAKQMPERLGVGENLIGYECDLRGNETRIVTRNINGLLDEYVKIWEWWECEVHYSFDIILKSCQNEVTEQKLVCGDKIYDLEEIG